MILDEMFKFPCVMVDGDNEMSKKSLYSGSGNDPELDIVIGECEYPHFALIGVSDKWMPNERSFQSALQDEKFDACLVTWANIGQVLVPWSKEKFKKEFRKFVATIKPKAEIQLITLTEEQIKQIEDEQAKRDSEPK